MGILVANLEYGVSQWIEWEEEQDHSYSLFPPDRPRNLVIITILRKTSTPR